MIYFSHNRSPLPDELDVRSALACTSDYVKYHRHVDSEIRNTLTKEDYESLVEKARKTNVALKKLGLIINAEYITTIREEFHKQRYEGTLSLVIVLVLAGALFALPYLTTFQTPSWLGAAAFAYYLYVVSEIHSSIANNQSLLEERRLERKRLELDLAAACRPCSGWIAEQLATIMLYLRYDSREWVYPGQIDQNLRPKKQRPVPPFSSANLIFEYGANFEDPKDPRVSEHLGYVVWVKLLVASLPDSLKYEISEAFQDKRSYAPSYLWDYAEFQDDWENGRVPKLGG